MLRIQREIYIVAYHDISSEANSLTSQLLISTPPEVFRKQISYFSKHYDIIGADDLFSDQLPRRPLLLTFDDAYRSVLYTAGPILKEINAPSIFFVIASAVKGDSLPIDNVLSLAIEELGLPRVLRLMGVTAVEALSVGDILFKFVGTMRLHEVAAIKTRIFAALGISEVHARGMFRIFLDAGDLRKLRDYRMEVGNHSMTHSHFGQLSERELDIEIGESRCELQQLSGQSVRCLSVPYGHERNATPSAVAIARASGHEAIFLGHARSNRFRSDHTYYRIGLRDEAPEDLARTLRIYPILRSVGHALIRRERFHFYAACNLI